MNLRVQRLQKMNYALNGYEIEPQELLLWPFEYQAVKNFVQHGCLRQKLIIHY